MKLIEQLKNRKNWTYLGILIIGIILGWLIFGGSDTEPATKPLDAESTSETTEASATVWTCSMHPQIRQDHPGKCPICGMELIPLENSEGSGGETAGQFTVKLTNNAMKIAEVTTSRIEKITPYKEVYLPGKVMADERNIAELTARYPGRIEKLNVNFTGQKVWKGQVLSKIYSPELITAQKELFEAIKYQDSNPRYYEAVRNKLKLWDVTEKQIDDIEQSGDILYYFNILSPLTGTITMRHVAIGDYVKEGQQLFQVINLCHIWVMFDAYESDLPWIRLHDRINFTIKSIPGKNFTSSVTFIDPVIDPKSRVAHVRAELNNPDGILKPEMLTSGVLNAKLHGDKEALVVPKSAILWTGKKAVVYVKTGDRDNLFQYREIELGADAGDYYVVANGLMEGEEVATNGVFKIDAAAQLNGKQSMMNPEGGITSTGMANMPGMDMGKNTDSDHEMESQKPVEQSMNLEMKTDERFKDQLTSVYDKYLNLKDALFDSDLDKTKTAVATIQTQLKDVDMTLLKGDAHIHWMELLNKINSELTWLDESTSLDKARSAFAGLSSALVEAVKNFGLKDRTAYYQYCPMANKNEGAYWLSQYKEIKNPYFGEQMPTCGETKEVIE